MHVPKIFSTFAIAALSFAIAWTGSPAHEGEDHGESKPVSITVSAAPRAEAASERFELVAIARNGTLTIYLDRLSTNEPITNAAISVETPAGSVVASPEPGGTYKLPAPWTITAGHYDLIFTVESDGTEDVLTATLEMPMAAAVFQSPSAAANDGLLGQLRQRIAAGDSLLILISIASFALGVVVMGLLSRRKLVPAVALLAIFAATLTTAALAHDGEDNGGDIIKTAMPGDRDRAKRLVDGSPLCLSPRKGSLRSART